LFFNLAGRAEENAFRPQAAQRFASDCDRFATATARAGQDLAEPLRRAPELTLEQLERLLGFVPPWHDPREAARLLLRCLAGRANGPTVQLDWDGGAQRRKPVRAVKDARKTAEFEEVVAAAGKLMEASHFGAAAIFSGLGAVLSKQMQSVNKVTQYGMRLQMFIDSGLTEQQAEETLQAEKEERRAQARRKMERQNRAPRG
jgi:hypothetical protein